MNEFQQKLHLNSFVITTEITPPKGIDIAPLQKEVEQIKTFVDGINITDNHRATMHLSALATAHKIRQWGGTPILQVTCRDLNRLAIQSLLLGAAVLDINTVVTMHGDDPTKGDHPETKGVFDLNSISLLETIKVLNNGQDLSGKTLTGHPNIFSGAVASPCDNNQELQLQRFNEKITAGAQFFQTQAIFEPEKLIEFINKAKEQNKNNFKLIAGIIILKSQKLVDFLNEKVPGITIDHKTRARMENKDHREGLLIALELIEQIKKHVDGIHIMAVGLEEQLPSILLQMQNLRH
ncbi:MAG: methylenetetrahydrofolate reductase [bacterium]